MSSATVKEEQKLVNHVIKAFAAQRGLDIVKYDPYYHDDQIDAKMFGPDGWCQGNVEALFTQGLLEQIRYSRYRRGSRSARRSGEGGRGLRERAREIRKAGYFDPEDPDTIYSRLQAWVLQGLSPQEGETEPRLFGMIIWNGWEPAMYCESAAGVRPSIREFELKAVNPEDETSQLIDIDRSNTTEISVLCTDNDPVLRRLGLGRLLLAFALSKQNTAKNIDGVLMHITRSPTLERLAQEFDFFQLAAIDRAGNPWLVDDVGEGACKEFFLWYKQGEILGPANDERSFLLTYSEAQTLLDLERIELPGISCVERDSAADVVGWSRTGKRAYDNDDELCERGSRRRGLTNQAAANLPLAMAQARLFPARVAGALPAALPRPVPASAVRFRPVQAPRGPYAPGQAVPVEVLAGTQLRAAQARAAAARAALGLGAEEPEVGEVLSPSVARRREARQETLERLAARNVAGVGGLRLRAARAAAVRAAREEGLGAPAAPAVLGAGGPVPGAPPLFPRAPPLGGYEELEAPGTVVGTPVASGRRPPALRSGRRPGAGLPVRPPIIGGYEELEVPEFGGEALPVQEAEQPLVEPLEPLEPLQPLPIVGAGRLVNLEGLINLEAPEIAGEENLANQYLDVAQQNEAARDQLEAERQYREDQAVAQVDAEIKAQEAEWEDQAADADEEAAGALADAADAAQELANRNRAAAQADRVAAASFAASIRGPPQQQGQAGGSVGIGERMAAREGPLGGRRRGPPTLPAVRARLQAEAAAAAEAEAGSAGRPSRVRNAPSRLNPATGQNYYRHGRRHNGW
jgi:hypothetical protein